MNKRSLDIDGFPVVIEPIKGGARLVGDPDGTLYDGAPASLLNTPISIVNGAGPEGFRDKMWADFLARCWISYGVGGLVPADIYPEPARRQALEQIAARTGVEVSSPLWFVWFEGVAETYIPHSTLEKILRLARDVEAGGEIVLPQGTTERAVSAQATLDPSLTERCQPTMPKGS